jgi:hypothetical protein
MTRRDPKFLRRSVDAGTRTAAELSGRDRVKSPEFDNIKVRCSPPDGQGRPAPQFAFPLTPLASKLIRMPVYELTPLVDRNADWSRSFYRGRAVIRANDETDARAIAAYTFQLPKFAGADADGNRGPWQDRSSVSCRLSHDRQYLETGARGVLAPMDRAKKIPFH